MAISVSNLVAAPTTLAVGANTVSVNYLALATLASDNNVGISATSNNPNVRVVSVTPSTAVFPMLGPGQLHLNLQLSVAVSGGGALLATITLTFRPVTGGSIVRNLPFLY